MKDVILGILAILIYSSQPAAKANADQDPLEQPECYQEDGCEEYRYCQDLVDIYGESKELACPDVPDWDEDGSCTTQDVRFTHSELEYCEDFLFEWWGNSPEAKAVETGVTVVAVGTEVVGSICWEVMVSSASIKAPSSPHGLSHLSIFLLIIASLCCLRRRG